MGEFEKPPVNRWKGLAQAIVLKYLIDIYLPYTRLRSKIDYNLTVSKQKHADALSQTEIFATEVLTFLDADTLNLLKPLQLSPSQLSLFYFTLNEWEKGDLRQASISKSMVDAGKYPLLELSYIGTNFHPKIGPLIGQPDYKLVFLSFRWMVPEKRPLEFQLSGISGKQDCSIRFGILPDRADSCTDGIEAFNFFRSDANAGVYQDGQRVVLNYEFQRGKERIIRTEQYYLIGTFISATVNNESLFVYGSNDKQHLRENRQPNRESEQPNKSFRSVTP